jgi:hypothetical protein
MLNSISGPILQKLASSSPGNQNQALPGDFSGVESPLTFFPRVEKLHLRHIFSEPQLQARRRRSRWPESPCIPRCAARSRAPGGRLILSKGINDVMRAVCRGFFALRSVIITVIAIRGIFSLALWWYISRCICEDGVLA